MSDPTLSAAEVARLRSPWRGHWHLALHGVAALVIACDARTGQAVSMRAFAALRPPLEIVEDLADFLEPRREAGGPRWTRDERLHLTRYA